MQQFIFNLEENDNYKCEDYIICKANLEIFNYLHKWPNWGNKPSDRIILIHGGVKSGKTHISHIWKNISSAKFISCNDIYQNHNLEIISNYDSFIIDDFENLLTTEENLLHFINLINQCNKFLLITSKTYPKNLSIKLADLKSRLVSFLEFKLPEIDDELFKLITFKYFADKHIVVNDKIINYMLSRTDRTFTSLKQIINMIDRKALIEKRSVSLTLVRQILENI